MKKICLTLCVLLVSTSSVFFVSAVEKDWVDVTDEVAGNPLDKGGWTVDEQGKVFRSENGNTVRIVHSEYGVFLVTLTEGNVEKVDGDKKIPQKKTELLQRDGGMMLVVRTDEYKFRVRFSERVSGMQAVSGIRGM